MKETKVLTAADLKMVDGDGSSGGFTGYASVFNEVDLVGDTIVPGAYAATLAKFLKDGFISFGHDWNAPPIATVDVAREDARGLWLEASFHSHDAAQRIRTLAAERLARGKTMGLSIGFAAKDWSRRDDGVRELRAIDLVETSLVTAAAEPNAQVTGVKARDWPHGGDAEAQLRGLERALTELKEGRVFSARNLERIKENIGRVRGALDALDDLEALLEEGSGTPAKPEDDGESGAAAAPEDDGKAARADALRAWAEYQQGLFQRVGGQR